MNVYRRVKNKQHFIKKAKPGGKYVSLQREQMVWFYTPYSPFPQESVPFDGL